MKSISNHPRSWRSSDLALCSGLNLFYVLSLYLWPATWSRKFNRDAPLNILRRLISCSAATTVAVGVLSWRYRKVTNGSVRDALRLLLFGVAQESSLTQLCLGTFRAIGITFSQMICLYSGPIATDLLYRWLRSRHRKYSVGSSVTPDFVNLAGIHPTDPTVGCHVHVPNTSSFELFTDCRDECLELEVSSSKPLHDTFVSSSSSSVEFLLNEEDDLLAHVLVLICLPLRVLRLLQSLAFDTTRWPTRSWIRYVCSPSVRNYVVAPITEELTYRGVMHSLLHLSHAEVAVCGLSPNQIIVGSSRLIESKISQTVSGLFVVAHVHHVFNLWRIHGTAQTTSSRHPYARTLNHSNARKPVSPHLVEKNDDVQLPNRDYASQQQPHGGFRGAVMEQAFMTQPTQSTSCSESNSSSSSMWGDDTELEEDDMACPRMITFSNVSSGLSAAGMSNLDSTEGNTLHAVVPQSGTVTGALPPTNITDNEGEDTYMTNRDVVSLLIGNAVTHWIFSAMASRVHRANKYHILAPIILHSLCNYFGVPEISRVLLLSRASRIAGIRSRFHVVALQVGVGITYVGGIVGFFLLTTV